MSLRSFHIFFIVTALALMAFLAYWSGHHYFHHAPEAVAHAHKSTSHFGLMVSSIAGLLIGVSYLVVAGPIS